MIVRGYGLQRAKVDGQHAHLGGGGDVAGEHGVVLVDVRALRPLAAVDVHDPRLAGDRVLLSARTFLEFIWATQIPESFVRITALALSAGPLQIMSWQRNPVM